MKIVGIVGMNDSNEFKSLDEFFIVKDNATIEQSIDAIFDYWVVEEHKRDAFKVNMYRLLGKERAITKALPTEAEKFVKFVANDYLELSHDKVMFQRNDWFKRAKKILWG